MRPPGRIFFPWFLLGILQPHLDCGRGLRPLPFAAIGTRARGKMVAIGTSEKLAQEGLRRNRDRLAVGLRVPRARMVGRSPRDRCTVGSRVPRDRRPPRRPVRMYDNSMHRNRPAFQLGQ